MRNEQVRLEVRRIAAQVDFLRKEVLKVNMYADIECANELRVLGDELEYLVKACGDEVRVEWNR